MGKLTRIKELEYDISWWRKKAKIADEVKDYLETLAEMPDDAVLLYTIGGIKMQHEIGKIAKVLLDRIKHDRR